MDSNAQTTAHNWFAQRLQNDGIDPMQLAKAIWRRKWSILSLAIAVSIVATLAAYSITPLYRAAATLLIEQKNANVVSIEQIYGIEGSGSEYLKTQFEVLKSRGIAERVVRELELTGHPSFDPRQQPEPLFNLSGIISSLNISKAVPAILPEDLEQQQAQSEKQIFDAVVRNVMSRTTLTPVQGTQLVKVEVELADPHEAARIANALTTAYIEDQMEAKMDMSTTATSWMNGRLNELRETLKQSEGRLQAFREREKLVDVDGVATISAAELSATSDRMISARTQRAEAESLYRQVQSMRSGGWEKLATVPAVLGDPLIQQFKSDEAKARAKFEELSKRYGARHPAMEAARSDLTAASASLKSQVEQVVAGIERNYQLAIANENALRSSVDANKTQIQNISRKEFQVRELQREVDANRALYETFMTRLKETSATEGLESANARIIEEAVPPTGPVSPKKGMIIGAVAMLALLLGAGLTALLEILNNTFKSTEEVENKLNLPVLGILPLIKGKERKEIARLFGSSQDKSFAESIRTIRTGVVLSGMDDPHKILVVTSSIPGEGKSTVATNLAYALGQMEKVLLIDADMRRPTLAKNFDFTIGTPGLANLIAGTAKLEECVKQVDGIDMLSAGAVPPNPLELLSSARFEKAIEFLRSKYDRIVIDSPPTQAVSDALILGTMANALIYVVKSEATPVPLVQKGIGQLLQSNAPVTGVVLNQVDIKKAQKHGYSYGGYYDYYGYSSDPQKA